MLFSWFKLCLVRALLPDRRFLISSLWRDFFPSSLFLSPYIIFDLDTLPFNMAVDSHRTGVICSRMPHYTSTTIANAWSIYFFLLSPYFRLVFFVRWQTLVCIQFLIPTASHSATFVIYRSLQDPGFSSLVFLLAIIAIIIFLPSVCRLIPDRSSPLGWQRPYQKM